MNKVIFNYAQFTKSFQGWEIMVTQDSLEIELRDDDEVLDVLPRIFQRVLKRIPKAENLKKEYPFDTHGFSRATDTVHIDSKPDKKIYVWERYLGNHATKERSDIIRVTSTFPPEIAKRYEQELEARADARSVLR